MGADEQAAVGVEVLRRIAELEGKFDSFLDEFHAYVSAAHAERQDMRVFIEDDVRGLLGQLAELARKHRSGLTDLTSAIQLQMAGDPGYERRS